MARGLAVAVVALLVLAAPAAATHTVVVDCDGLQAELDTVHEGKTITVQEGEVCTDAYTLPTFPSPTMGNYTSWTLEGGGTGATFDGGSLGAADRSLTGASSHWVTIQNFTFRDGDITGNGGAISLTGESRPFIALSTFVGNAAGGDGGAVYVSQADGGPGFNIGGASMLGNTFGSETTPSLGNSADGSGGAVAIRAASGGGAHLTSNTFANNVATGNGGAYDVSTPPMSGGPADSNENRVIDNTAGGSGGGGHVVSSGGTVHVDNSVFERNSVEPIAGATHPTDSHYGGGLYIEGGNPRFRNNEFRGNSVKDFPNGLNYGGGGLAVIAPGVSIDSEFTRVEGNTVAGQVAPTQLESEGGGIYFSGNGASWYGFLDAIAGNSVGDLGEGGGMYVGASTQMTLELGEVTVANNTVGAGGQGAGLAGGGADDLIARNSLIWNEPNHTGFDSLDVTWSLMCGPGGAPVPGEGNICADPKLVGGTDIHQTKESPTIDKGNDAYFEDEGGGERAETDYEDDPRPTDGDGDGHTIDMGADETPADFAKPAQQPPPPPPPQCSDGVDNDGDGAIDAADPGCLAGPTDDNEGDESLQDVFLCGERTISLVRADARGRRVVLSGIVASSVAGQPVDLFVRYLGRRGRAKKLATVTPGADGQFRARVKGPPRSLFSRARYRATVAGSRSVELKLPQSLASSSLRQVTGGMLELRGQVDRKLLGRRNVVVVKRILCANYTTVGQARPNRRGRYVVRFPAPTTGGSALYRAESRVLARPGAERYVRQFARAIGITF